MSSATCGAVRKATCVLPTACGQLRQMRLTDPMRPVGSEEHGRALTPKLKSPKANGQTIPISRASGVGAPEALKIYWRGLVPVLGQEGWDGGHYWLYHGGSDG